MSVVIDPPVLPVVDVARRPLPWTRTHTLASFFDTSMPAQRRWITSMTTHSFPRSVVVEGVSGKAQTKQKSHSHAHRQQSTSLALSPRDALQPHAHRRAHRQQGGIGVNETP